MFKTRTTSPFSTRRSFLADLKPHLTSRHNWLWIIPLLLLTTWLTASHLKGAFWNDEVTTVTRAGSPIHGGPFSPAQIWEHTASTTYDQVPGYFWLISVWDNLLGWSEYSTRLLSLMAGLLGVACVYRLGRDLHSPTAGLGEAAALASSAFYIYYLHEARTYALSVLLAAITIWLYWRIISRPTGWRTQALLVISAAALLYTHYFAALIVFAICLYHLLFVPKNREWWRVVILLGTAGALFLPWFLTSFDVIQGASSQQWRQDMSLAPQEITNDLLGLFSNQNVVLLLLFGVLALSLRRPAQRYGWFMLVGPFVLALAVNAWLGMLVMPKYLLVLWVPIALIFGFGLARLTEYGLHPALVLTPWIIVGVWSTLTWQEDPVKYVAWDVLHDQLAEQIQPDDVVIFHLNAGLWDGTHPRGLQHYFYDFPALPNLLWSWPHVSDDVYLQEVPEIVEGKLRIWSAYEPGQRPPVISKFEETVQDMGFASCGRAARNPDMAVDLFARQPQTMPYQFGSDLYEDGIAMTLLGLISEMPDHTLAIPLGWRVGDDVPVNTYSFAIHLINSAGGLAAQKDIGLPPDHEFGCQVVQIANPTPGEYQVSLVVYAWETGTLLNAAGLPEGERVNLGAITIGA